MMKKTWKMRTFAAFCVLVLSISALAGCGKKETPAETNAEPERISEVTIKNTDQVFTSGLITNYNEEGTNEIQYDIVISEDGKAQYVETFYYGDYYYVAYHYTGTAVISDGVIEFTTDSDDDTSTIYTLTLDGDRIAEVENQYMAGECEVAGSYTGVSEEYGQLKLDIDQFGNAVLLLQDGTQLTGTIFLYYGDWDLMVSTDEEDRYLALDWIMEFKGNTFTYKSYSEQVYGDYEGTYTMVGDLGTINLKVDAFGGCTAVVTIDGAEHYMVGGIRIDSDMKILTGAYLDGDGYSMDLLIVELDDGTLNYSGSYAIPLGAG